jgi:Oxidoreductase family, NAD-binding Rossmann fold
LRIGMIGLDTSHVPAFAKLINAPKAEGKLAQMQVVAGFPGGSDDIPSSRDRVVGFTQELKEMGVEIVDSIDTLLTKVDAVLLESVDGRKHLEQVLPVFRAGKPVFIDKPLAGNLADALAIGLLAEKYNARWFSSSSLRFSPNIARWRDNAALREEIRGAESWGPCSIDPTHTDLYWYGVHGVETLYTAMGTGCQRVSRVHTDGTDLVVGQWSDGRVGTFRGIRDGKADYGLVIFGKKTIDVGGKYEGYAPLVDRIADFFLGGPPPVSAEETLEMFTFMQAADVSVKNGGAQVELKSVRDVALAQAKEIIAKIDKN